MRANTFLRSIASLLLAGGVAVSAQAQTLLNVSYDVSRELYKDVNPAFAAKIKAEKGQTVTVNQSHGGSSKQAMSVAAGLEADIITMNQAPDIDVLVSRKLVPANWRDLHPYQATIYTTPSVFLVRKGNPKNIKDWGDLARDGINVIVPNPKTSGNGRYTYAAAWGYGLEQTGTDEGAEKFVRALFKNVPVLDGGGRGATTTFTQRGVGDVLVTFENEAILISKEVDNAEFDIVYPSVTIEAPAPVAVVQRVAEKRKTAELAKAYLDFLYTKEGQTIIAKHNFRPRDAEVLKANANKFPQINTFTVEDKLGGWESFNKRHFNEGALYDQIMVNR